MGAWYMLYSANTLHFAIVGASTANERQTELSASFLQISYGRVCLQTKLGRDWTALCAPSVTPLYEWHHTMGTWSPEEGGRLRLYADGVLVGLNSTRPLLGSMQNPLYIGLLKGEDARNGLIGQMDDVRAWQTELAPAEVAMAYAGGAVPRGLVLHVEADGDNATHAIDKSGHGNHGVLIYGEAATTEVNAPFSYRPDCLSCSSPGSPACTPYSRLSVCGDGAVTGDEQDYGCAPKDHTCETTVEELGKWLNETGMLFGCRIIPKECGDMQCLADMMKCLQKNAGDP
eukprot:m51a1_g14170 hypothetical protein (287) ;mRNA; f:16914-18003